MTKLAILILGLFAVGIARAQITVSDYLFSAALLAGVNGYEMNSNQCQTIPGSSIATSADGFANFYAATKTNSLIQSHADWVQLAGTLQGNCIMTTNAVQSEGGESQSDAGFTFTTTAASTPVTIVQNCGGTGTYGNLSTTYGTLSSNITLQAASGPGAWEVTSKFGENYIVLSQVVGPGTYYLDCYTLLTANSKGPNFSLSFAYGYSITIGPGPVVFPTPPNPLGPAQPWH